MIQQYTIQHNTHILQTNPKSNTTHTAIQMQILFVLLLLLIHDIACQSMSPQQPSSAAQPQQSMKQDKYSQSLSVSEEGLIILQFNVPNRMLPIPLMHLMKDNRAYITVQYGPYFHQSSSRLAWWNGISSQLYTKCPQCVPKLALQLSQILHISLTPRHTVKHPSSKSGERQNSTEHKHLLFSNPNDKFCLHHIEAVIRNILPCQDFSGLGSLIDVELIFTTGIALSVNARYGMKIQWQQSRIKINIVLEGIPNIVGIRKAKVRQRCMGSQLRMVDANNDEIGMNEITLNRLQQSIRQQSDIIMQKQNTKSPRILIGRQIIGNWYSPNKKLEIKLTIPNAIYLVNQKIIVSQLLPLRSHTYKVIVTPSSMASKTVCSNIQNNSQMKYRQPNVLCTVEINHYEGQSEQKKKEQNTVITVSFYLHGKLMNFDQYQSIFGGGTEIMTIPVIFQQGNTTTKIYPPVVSLKTPQPDQSLPFQVITFVVGIFGYLWVSIWRKFTSDLKKHKQECTADTQKYDGQQLKEEGKMKQQ